ncbi:flavanone 3-dioxygenase 2-like [Neltuma alba]|uniref:flavanone 3-dioxygenase 2-like n=1 Tax=Neltuma alba TaxID=207710 RepID=UPI0010A59A42|nr:flavanone 3-dioxygenase 2-like [Prosopis alba]
MAEIASPPSLKPYTDESSLTGEAESYSAKLVDDEIPTVDYSMLFSNDPDQASLAIEHLGQVCQDYGFFYLVNHQIPDEVLDTLFKGISEFFDPTTLEERRTYSKKDPTDRIRWGLNCSSGENREYIKVIAHPQYHFPPNPSSFSDILGGYHKEMRKVVMGLAKAISKTLGLEESYIEKAFNLKSGFDVSAMNLYPPNYVSKGRIGLPDHTDPGFIVTLVQDVNGGLQILSHKGDWINAYIPRHAILIQLGDHLERISVATLHGPSLDKLLSPAPAFVNEEHPQAYLGMTYKQSLEASGADEIDVQSSLDQIRLLKV